MSGKRCSGSWASPRITGSVITGLKYTTATNASILMTSMPVLTAGLPVNVRPAGNEETGTAISFICANLATNVEDLRDRLDRAHWPDELPGDGDYGVKQSYIRSLYDHWRTAFDWRALERWGIEKQRYNAERILTTLAKLAKAG